MIKDFFYRWHNKTLHNHVSEVDIDAIWAAIEPEVDAINVKRKRRKRFFFLFFCTCVALVGIGIAGLLITHQNSKDERIITKNNINATSQKEGTQIAQNSISKNINTIELSNSDPTTLSKQKQATSADISSPNFISPSKILNNGDHKEELWRHSRQNITSKVYITEQEKGSDNIFEQVNNSPSAKSTSDIDFIERNNTSKPTTSVSEPKVVSIPKNIPSLPLESLSSFNNDLPTKKVLLQKAAPFRLSLSLYSGLALVNKNLDLKDNADSEDLLMLRESTERNLELWNNGIKARFIHKSGISLNIGLQYSRIAENFTYNNQVLNIDSTGNQIIGYSNNLLGDQSPIIGFAPNNTSYDLEYDFYNYYHFLDLPIGIGFQKQYGSWNFGANAAYVYNFSLKTKGRILSNSFEAININDENISPFSTRVPASFEFGLSAAYYLSSHLSVGMEATYRNQSNSITKNDYALRQSYSWSGINLGINYNF